MGKQNRKKKPAQVPTTAGDVVMFDHFLGKVERVPGDGNVVLIRFGGESYAHGPNSGTARVVDDMLVAIKPVGGLDFKVLETPEPITARVDRWPVV